MFAVGHWQQVMARLVVVIAMVVALVGEIGSAPRAALALQQAPCAEPTDETGVPCPVASPESSPLRPGTMLLQESFDDPSSGLLGFPPRVPGQSRLAYVDGYLKVSRLAEGGTAIVLLPHDVDHDHATVAISAQLVDEVAGLYVMLGCRRQDVETQTGYRLAVATDSGMFTLVRREAAVEVALAAWQESGAIRRGTEWNRLELTCTGPSIDAIVNGQVVASVQDEVYPRGQALLGVGVFPGQGAPAEAHFDDLLVTRR